MAQRGSLRSEPQNQSVTAAQGSLSPRSEGHTAAQGSKSSRSVSHSSTGLPEPSSAVSCAAQAHSASSASLFEGCGLPGILRVQVLSILPQPSQRQHKSRKECFALWLLHQKSPQLLPGKFLVEGKAALHFSAMHGVCVLLFKLLSRLRGRNYS